MTLYAAHIGLNYRGTGNDLSVCAADARDLRGLFGGMLLSGKQSRENLFGELREASSLPAPNQWGVLSFSGHGTQVVDKSGDEGDGYDEAFCTHEKDGGIDTIVDDEVQGLLRGRNRKARILLIADSCFSGTAHRAMPSLPMANLKKIRRQRMRYMPASMVRRNRRKVKNEAPQSALPNVVVMSACADFEYAYEGKENGILTGAMLATYKTGITIRQWWEMILDVVAETKYGGAQHPQLSCSRAALKWIVPEH